MKTACVLVPVLAAVGSVVAGHDANTTIARRLQCPLPTDGLNGWFYNSKSDGPYRCKPDNAYGWTMLNSYRSGGTEGVHWKYTEDPNNFDCLNYWKYYESDGRTLIMKVMGRKTMQGGSRRWCAMPVYRSGGAQGYQWANCGC